LAFERVWIHVYVKKEKSLEFTLTMETKHSFIAANLTPGEVAERDWQQNYFVLVCIRKIKQQNYWWLADNYSSYPSHPSRILYAVRCYVIKRIWSQDHHKLKVSTNEKAWPFFSLVQRDRKATLELAKRGIVL
jgi:hypothetical protein